VTAPVIPGTSGLEDPRWNYCDQASAWHEGWDIFRCDDLRHEPYEIECIDFPEVGEVKLADDTEAAFHVIDRAAEGSVLHQRAIAFLLAEAPNELAHWAAVRSGGVCPCRGCEGKTWPRR